ncbi:hypothetical protein LWI29_019728 [Acer saccharum]|uniref:Chitin-binding type-1 domain-containing protein n=1 Tax=Acer saccharum TaxID=4024 RepID=A0AA39RZQ0_ACESA|nr:hypothetical protein LWI29_019728 [Acer saccharum]
MSLWVFSVVSLVLSYQLTGSSAEQCGSNAGGAVCPGGLCCSQFGWCGNTPDYCTTGCQSQCSGGVAGGSGGDLGSTITRSQYDEMFKHIKDCTSKGFYSYDDFISAAKSYSAFASTGDTATRKREVAAFLAQTSHETTGGWATAPDGPYAWGYCFLKEQNPQSSYCASGYPCPKQYYGRGPIQLSWNYNYQECGKDIGADLINNPDLLTTNAVISFKSALWFWMTPQSPKPSCHDVITGKWQPSAADQSAGRVTGYGVITNIINGGIECGHGKDSSVDDRIGYYKRYCDILGVGYGNNLDCYRQKSFGNELLLESWQ